MKKICQLCVRQAPRVYEHHIVPRSCGGREVVYICKDCHRQLHAMFDNKKLSNDLNTIESILENELFSKYLSWVKNKPCGVAHKARRSKGTKKRGRGG